MSPHVSLTYGSNSQVCCAHTRLGRRAAVFSPMSCAVALPPLGPAPAEGWDSSVRGTSVLCPAAALVSAAVFLKGSCCVFQGAAKMAFATDLRENGKIPKNLPGKVKQSKEKPLQACQEMRLVTSLVTGHDSVPLDTPPPPALTPAVPGPLRPGQGRSPLPAQPCPLHSSGPRALEEGGCAVTCGWQRARSSLILETGKVSWVRR